MLGSSLGLGGSHISGNLGVIGRLSLYFGEDAVFADGVFQPGIRQLNVLFSSVESDLVEFRAEFGSVLNQVVDGIHVSEFAGEHVLESFGVVDGLGHGRNLYV